MKNTFTLLLIVISYSAISAQELFDGEWYQPMPINNLTAMPEQVDTFSKMISYDPLTKTENLWDLPVDETPLQEDTAFELPSAAEPSPLDFRNFTEFERINDPTAYPNRTNVKLFMKYPQGNYVCSGVLIDAKHVLTAGHCIFSRTHQQWADEITVVPAYENGEKPYGQAKSKRLYSWTGWTQDFSYQSDMGLILLDKPIGALTGWLGYGYYNSTSFFEENTFENSAYPSESPFDGRYMYTRSGDYDVVTTNILRFNRESFGGASGSGTYHTKSDGRRTVYAVHSHTQTNSNTGAKRSGQTRITNSKFDYLYSTRLENTADTPQLTPFSLSSDDYRVDAGNSLSKVRIRIYNDSENDFADDLKISFFLVNPNGNEMWISDQEIADLQIESRRSRSLTFTNSMIIPENISADEYVLRAYVFANGAEAGQNHTADWREPTLDIRPLARLELNQDTIDFEYFASSFGITLSSNIDWEVEIDQPWVKTESNLIGNGNENISFQLEENPGKTPRMCHIRVYGGGLTREVVVRQANKAKANIDFNLFPNPVKDRFTITLKVDQSGIFQASLYNAMGQPVFHTQSADLEKGQSLELPVSTLEFQPGLYICRVSQGNRVSVQEVVIK